MDRHGQELFNRVPVCRFGISCINRKLAFLLLIKFLLYDVAVSMFLAVFRFLDINALDFRSKAGKLINAFYKVKEVFNGSFGPSFTRVDAEYTWRIGKCTFQREAAFRLFQVHQFAMSAHEFILGFLRFF